MGSRSEANGIAKSGAKMVMAVSCAKVCGFLPATYTILYSCTCIAFFFAALCVILEGRNVNQSEEKTRKYRRMVVFLLRLISKHGIDYLRSNKFFLQINICRYLKSL